MNIKQIRYFIAVAEELHMGRAAEKLHLSQPPLTRQIQALEQELSATLLIRTPHGVELTEAGRTFLRDAVTIQHLIEETTERTRRAELGQSGRLDIGIFGSAILTIMPGILSEFTKTHRDVEVVLHNAPFDTQVQAVLQRRLLIAFDRHVPDSTELTTELAHPDRLMVALHKDDPLTAKRTISLKDLVSDKANRGHRGSLGNKMTVPFQPRSVEHVMLRESPDMITAVSLVGGGLGTTLAPASISGIKIPNVVFRNICQKERIDFNLYCFYRRDEQSPLLAEILKVIRSRCPPSLPDA